jgi:two-component system, OmpR family, response regulator
MQDLDRSDKKRILYVDGYEDNRVLLAYLLHQLEYSCVAASTLSEGISAARSEAFDLYILDSWYRDGTGIDLCKRIRGFDPSAPIIFFSAWPLESARQEAIRAGASAYLLKPALDEVLILTRILLGTQQSFTGKSKTAPEVTPPVKSQVCNSNPIVL